MAETQAEEAAAAAALQNGQQGLDQNGQQSVDQSADNAGTSVFDPTTSVKRLRKPEPGNLLGTVVKRSFRTADQTSGGKFKRDTYICVIEDIANDKLHNVFITTRQWAEYDCAGIMFEGNIVNVGIEHCVEGETGYLENVDDIDLTPHEHTFDAFTQSLPMSEIAVMKQLSKSGLSDGLITSIVASITRQRANQGRSPQSGGSAPAFIG